MCRLVLYIFVFWRRGFLRVVFFFQAEDGIREKLVTGVQTCALPILEIKPSELVFSNLATEEGGEGSVHLFAYFSTGLQVVEQHFTHEETAKYFAAEFTPIPPQDLDAGIKSGLELKVTVKPGLPLGAFKQRIRFKTNLEDEGEQEVAITGKISGPVTVIATGWNQEHGVLVLGQVNRSEGVKRNVNL